MRNHGVFKGLRNHPPKALKTRDVSQSAPLIPYDLADIDEQAQERFERLIEDVKEVQGTTEQRKTDNDLEWIGRDNDIRACAREMVNKEIISTNTFVD